MFKLSIRTENAAFSQDCGGDRHLEIARILRETADRVGEGESDLTLRDINGNRVGHCDWTQQD